MIKIEINKCFKAVEIEIAEIKEESESHAVKGLETAADTLRDILWGLGRSVKKIFNWG